MKCKCFEHKKEYMLLREYKHWKLYIAESQFLLGWSHAILKRHIEYFDDLTDEELAELKQVVHDWKTMLIRAHQPDWFNVMQLGNMTKHLHFQLAPRYATPRTYQGRKFIDEDWGHMISQRWPIENEKFLTEFRNHLKEFLPPEYA